MSSPIVDGVYYIQNAGTGSVLTLANGSPRDNTQIQASRKLPLNNSRVSTQMWVVVQVDPEKPVYTLLNAAGRTYANTSGGATGNATPLVGFKRTGNRSQRWTINLSNDKINYVLKNHASGTYMDLNGGSASDGTPVQIWSGGGVSTSNKNKLWNFIHI